MKAGILTTLAFVTAQALDADTVKNDSVPPSPPPPSYLASVNGETNGALSKTAANQFFMADVSAYNTTDLNLYGYTTRNSTRNGYKSLLRWDSYNTQFVEQTDSSHAILIGPIDSGISNTSILKQLNAITFGADWINSKELQAQIGSNNLFRTNANLNQVLIQDQLSARICLLDSSSDPILFGQRRYSLNEQRIYTAWNYKPAPLNRDDTTFSVTGNFEHSQSHERSENVDYRDQVDIFEIQLNHEFSDHSFGYNANFTRQWRDDIHRDKTRRDYALIETFARHDFTKDSSDLLPSLLGNQELRIGYTYGEENHIPSYKSPEYSGRFASIEAPQWNWTGSWIDDRLSASVAHRNSGKQSFTDTYPYSDVLEVPNPGQDHFAVAGFTDRSIKFNLSGKSSTSEAKKAELWLTLSQRDSEVPITDIRVSDIFNRAIRNSNVTSRTASLEWLSQNRKWIATASWHPKTKVANATGASTSLTRFFSSAESLTESLSNWPYAYLEPSPASTSAGYETERDYLMEVSLPAYAALKQSLLERFPVAGNWFKKTDQDNIPAAYFAGPVIPTYRASIREDFVTQHGWDLHIIGQPSDQWCIALHASSESYVISRRFHPEFASLTKFLEQNLTEPIMEITRFDEDWGWRGIRSFLADFEDVNLTDELEVDSVDRTFINAISTYTFTDGKLAGFRIGGALRYDNRNSTYLNYDLTTNSFHSAKGSTSTVDFWIGYEREIYGVHWSLQLNAFDLFNQDDKRAYRWNDSEADANRDWSISSSVSF